MDNEYTDIEEILKKLDPLPPTDKLKKSLFSLTESKTQYKFKIFIPLVVLSACSILLVISFAISYLYKEIWIKENINKNEFVSKTLENFHYLNSNDITSFNAICINMQPLGETVSINEDTVGRIIVKRTMRIYGEKNYQNQWTVIGQPREEIYVVPIACY